MNNIYSQLLAATTPGRKEFSYDDTFIFLLGERMIKH